MTDSAKPKPILLFDLGGVLVDLGKPNDAMGLDLDTEAFWSIWLESSVVQQYETGRLSTQQFYAAFGPAVGVPDPDDFAERFTRWQLLLFPEIEALVRSAAKTHQLALLSNTNQSHWNFVLSQTDMFSLFFNIFLSYEIGCLKPSEEAFKTVLSELGCSPGDVLFLDDTKKNVDAARTLGINAVQVRCIDDISQTIAC